MPALSKEQLKQKKAAESSLYRAINRIKSDWSFKKKPWTFKDLLIAAGLDDLLISAKGYFESELSKPISFDDVKSFCQDLEIAHNTEWYLLENPPNMELTNEEKLLVNRTETSLSEKTIEEEREIWESDLGSKDYGLPSSAKEKAFLFWFQKKACKELLDGITVQNKRGQLLLAGVGTGKTFIYGAMLRRLIDMNFHYGKTFTPFPYVVVTKASIIEQTKRVLEKFFGIDTENEVLVTNYDQLRSTFGKIFVREKIEIIQGEEHYTWEWKNNLFPCVIIWDECQALKNLDSLQSKIGQSFNEINSPHTYQIFSSATPYTRVIEAKCFCVSTRIKHNFGVARGIELTNKHWNDFAESICPEGIKPEEHSPAAIGRLTDKMEDYIVRIKGVKTQFKAKNSVLMIDFENEQDRQYYLDAWNRYLAEKAKLENDPTAKQTGFMILVQFLKFRQAAELCRAKYIAQAMYHSVQEGQAAVAALNFKNTITKIVKILIEEYHVPREQISLIWGGAAATPTKKQKKKMDILSNQKLLDAMESEGITLEDFDLDDVEDQPEFTKDIPDEYKLGAQSLKERQKEIDKFQQGKSLYCFYTFRAGGVGLSLHHTDEFTKEKVRHKESGYAYEEDIPKIPTRPRINFVAPTYSAIELVQGLGRCPRLTSLSDTPQLLVFYKNTIEARVAYIVSVKLRCLGKVVKTKESWEDVCIKTHADDQEEMVQRHIKDVDELTNSKQQDDDSPNEGMFTEDEDEE